MACASGDHEAPFERSLAALLSEPESPARQGNFLTALAECLGARAVRMAVCGGNASVGESLSSSPHRIPIRGPSRSFGCLEVWPADSPALKAFAARLELAASAIAAALERVDLQRTTREFLDKVTHDVRGSIVRTHNLNQMLTRSGSLNEEQTAIQKMIEADLTTAETLLRKLAEHAKAGSSGEPFQRIDSSSLVNAVRWNMKGLLAEKSAAISADDATGDVSVRERDFVRALELTISTLVLLGSTNILIRTEPHPEECVWVVEDAGGSGSSQEWSAAQKSLDLAIARRIVEAMGGRLEIADDGRKAILLRLDD